MAYALAAHEQAQAARRRRIRTLVGAGAALLMRTGLAVWSLARPSSARPRAAGTPTTATSAWSLIPVEARSKEMRDVGLPPTTVPRTGTVTMTITTNLGVIAVPIDRSAVPCAAASFAYLAGRHF